MGVNNRILVFFKEKSLSASHEFGMEVGELVVVVSIFMSKGKEKLK